MKFNPVVFDPAYFDGREDDLKKIIRYVSPLTPVMFYRTNDLIHSKRVRWHVEEAAPDILEVFPDLDLDYVRTLAEVHDDAEIVTGDVSLYEKELMQGNERTSLETDEYRAVATLVTKYGAFVNGFVYGNLLLAAKRKDTILAQLVSFFDKFDGAGEAWHEVWAGNDRFLRPAGGNHGAKGGYVRRLNEFPTKYPDLAPFFRANPGYLPEPHDFAQVAAKGVPHTIESLNENTGYECYDRWKNTVLNLESFSTLVQQIEFEPDEDRT